MTSSIVERVGTIGFPENCEPGTDTTWFGVMDICRGFLLIEEGCVAAL